MSEPWHILVVDDDAVYARTLAQALARRGHSVRCAGEAGEALALLRQTPADAVILDLRLATASGLALIEPIRALCPQARILLLTGYASIATAVEAIKLGATHYLPKPATVDDILTALGRTQGDAGTPVAERPLSVDRLEWEHLQRVLAQHGGNLSATARALKMHRRTLQRKLAKRPVRD
ncbi:MAG: response regulator transcription factor [Thiobacillaceae bacterium]|nr:response regulator transcription factor [Thiobacillaceae bacterium]MCX7674181.1 response regulator transcription factor [Thiobacillaceae bacterium]MDW8322881.1 response regulator transcription factor [Burkholderiales bacterium]